MKLEFLGAAEEVGRSAIQLSDRTTKIMMDYGIKIQKTPPEFPLTTENLDAIILSHAHLDHSGMLPLLYKNESPTLFTNDITLETSILLIKDSMKISQKERYDLGFSKTHLKKMINSARFMDYNQKERIGEFVFEFYDAGHIPGSAGTLLNHSSGKKIFYTGDIKIESTHLVNSCVLPKKSDILIIESTYSEKEHPKRADEEKRLKKEIEEVIRSGETALLPVFALGRSQEVLLILEEFANMIALDGMAKDICEITMKNNRYIKEPNRLKKILDRITWVRTREDRKKAVEKSPIIITTAGMMSGGPVLAYLRELRTRNEAKVLFTGYLIEDSPARILIDTGVFKNAEEKYDVHCDIKQFDLSAHAGRSELFKIIETLSPKQVFCVHGDNCKGFAKEIDEKLNIPAFAPKLGEEFEI